MQGAETIAKGVSNLATTIQESLEIPMVPTEPEPDMANHPSPAHTSAHQGLDAQDRAIRAGIESVAGAPEAIASTPLAEHLPAQGHDQHSGPTQGARGANGANINIGPAPGVPRDTIESSGEPDVSYEHRPKTLPRAEVEEREKARGERHEELGVSRTVVESHIRARVQPGAVGNAEAVHGKGAVERELLGAVEKRGPVVEGEGFGGGSAAASRIGAGTGPRSSREDNVSRTHHFGGIANGVIGEGAGELTGRRDRGDMGAHVLDPVPYHKRQSSTAGSQLEGHASVDDVPAPIPGHWPGAGETGKVEIELAAW
jgi:hypothetical protein